MTTTEIAVIDPDGTEVEAAPTLSKREAKALDKRIRTASDKFSTSTENLLDLLEQAAQGQIHVALELPSWTAWFKDAVQVSVSDRFERKELVKLMSGKGMSQRAIAGTLGVGQATVSRDIEGDSNGSPVTLGTDNKEYPRNGSKDEAEVIDAEVVDDEQDYEPMKAVDIVAAFDDETANLHAAANELHLFSQEDKWPGARRRVTNANMNTLQEIITTLHAIVDDLMTVV